VTRRTQPSGLSEAGGSVGRTAIIRVHARHASSWLLRAAKRAGPVSAAVQVAWD
jgi:hypothetical protein